MSRRLPPLNSLRAFEAAARHLSFTKAANELHVTPAAISHQIKALEEQLGVPLFRRLTRALRLTAAGQAALPPLRDGFDKLKGQMTGGMMFKFSEEWTSEDTLTFQARGLGQHITGQIDVFPEHIRIEVVLPNLLASIAETITGKVERQGRLLLEKK